MKCVAITRQTKVGGQALLVGQLYELSDRDALTLIRMGKAVPAANKPGKIADRETELAKNMTVKQLKAELGEYPSGAKKKDLIRLWLSQKT